MKNLYLLFSLLFTSGLFAQTTSNVPTTERRQIADEMESSIKNELLNKWYPQSTDSIYGGFLSTFTFDFKPTGPQDKFIVTQARHIWSTANAAVRYPENIYYLECSRNGFHFLRDVMWDKTYGGFYNLVDRKGNDKSNPIAPKEAYGNAFAIFALAAYYKSSKDTGALELAKKAFFWLEKHSHDAVYKGYYQHLQRDGTPVKRDGSIPTNAEIGYKDQNSSIHLLEAFTELYSVWPDKLVGLRLQEMLFLIRDKMVTKKGYLVLFFKPDWTPVSFRDSSEVFIKQHKNLDHVSFGHDVETAFLMLEASQILGLKNDLKTLAIGKKMVDHALRNGWDDTVGGFYDEAYYFKGQDTISILFDGKNWWAQAEGMNTLLMMADLYPRDKMHYYDKFTKLWNYTKIYLIDHVNGDWYEGGIDKQPNKTIALKGHIWKGTYHHFRSMSNCIERLQTSVVKQID